jgi:hypothetical protein
MGQDLLSGWHGNTEKQLIYQIVGDNSAKPVLTVEEFGNYWWFEDLV